MIIFNCQIELLISFALFQKEKHPIWTGAGHFVILAPRLPAVHCPGVFFFFTRSQWMSLDLLVFNNWTFSRLIIRLKAKKAGEKEGDVWGCSGDKPRIWGCGGTKTYQKRGLAGNQNVLKCLFAGEPKRHRSKLVAVKGNQNVGSDVKTSEFSTFREVRGNQNVGSSAGREPKRLYQTTNRTPAVKLSSGQIVEREPKRTKTAVCRGTKT
jgi:hypothetical protein